MLISHSQSKKRIGVKIGAMFERLEVRQLLSAAAFTSIQEAINSAAPGATINVGAGTFDELVTVNKPLILKGAHAGVDARDAARGTGETIVRGQDAAGGTQFSGFYITANNVTLDGFTVQDNASANLTGAAIIIGEGVSGTHITNDIIQGNVAGVFATKASNVTISHDLISGLSNPNSAAIRIDGGCAGIDINHNTLTGNLGAGVRISKIVGDANTNVRASSNDFFGNTGGALIVDAGAYSGTVDARNNYWGSASGPAGIGPGFGDAIIAPDHNVNFTPFSSAPFASPATDAGTPRGLRQHLIEDLAEVLKTLTGRARHIVKDAIANLKASLDGSLWIDDSHLAPGAGETIYKLDRKAIRQLAKALKGHKRSTLPANLVSAAQRIANLERLMAMIAINDATGGDAKKLRRANHELSAGVNNTGRGDTGPAIENFLNAWKRAIQAEHKKKKHKSAHKHAHGDHKGD